MDLDKKGWIGSVWKQLNLNMPFTNSNQCKQEKLILSLHTYKRWTYEQGSCYFFTFDAVQIICFWPDKDYRNRISQQYPPNTETWASYEVRMLSKKGIAQIAVLYITCSLIFFLVIVCAEYSSRNEIGIIVP